jgi:catechol 2,3-dioxygenase-like lactoylglutathione lyase family enzyme
MASLFPDLCTEDVAACRDFYTRLFDMKVVFENAWYAQLQHPEDPRIQIAFVQRSHESVPQPDRRAAAGVIVTFETDDAEGLHARAAALGLPIVQPLRDEAWGQRHFMTRDPAGLLVDVAQLIPPSAEFAGDYVTE